MTNDQIIEIVKKLEPLFLGYKAHERSLKNDNGMEIYFRCDWKGKTTVSGLHAKNSHSIGCSLTKSPEKIFKDIRNRLMPDYHKDFFETKRERLEREEAQNEDELKLKALASVIGGEISNHYGYRGASGNSYVDTANVSIYPIYNGCYEFKIDLNYINAMKLAAILKNFVEFA